MITTLETGQEKGVYSMNSHKKKGFDYRVQVFKPVNQAIDNETDRIKSIKHMLWAGILGRFLIYLAIASILFAITYFIVISTVYLGSNEAQQYNLNTHTKIVEKIKREKILVEVKDFTVFYNRQFNHPSIKNVTTGWVYDNSSDKLPSHKYCYIQARDTISHLANGKNLENKISNPHLYTILQINKRQEDQARDLCHN